MRRLFAEEAHKEPSRYLVLLVQFITRSLPDHLKISMNSDALHFEWQPGLQLSADSWQQVVARLSTGQLPRSSELTHSLEIALRLLLGLGELQVEIDYPSVGRLTVGPQKLQQEAYRPSSARINLQRSDSRPGTWPEVSILQRRLFFPTYTIDLNGQSFQSRVLDRWQNCYLWLVVPRYPTQPSLGIRSVPPVELNWKIVDDCGEFLEGFPDWSHQNGIYRVQSILSLGYDDAQANPAWPYLEKYHLLFRNGLLVGHDKLTIPGLFVASAPPSASMDATGSQLVQTYAVRLWLQDIEKLCHTFVRSAYHYNKKRGDWRRLQEMVGYRRRITRLIKSAHNSIPPIPPIPEGV